MLVLVLGGANILGLSARSSHCNFASARHPSIVASFLFAIGLAGCGFASPPSQSTAAVSPVQTPLALSASQNTSGKLTLQWTGGPPASTYDIYIDDTATFHQPILHQSLNANSVVLNPLDSGLATGVTYYAKVDPGNGQLSAQITFRLNEPSWTESSLSYDYAHVAWQSSGRQWMAMTCGLAWDTSSSAWKVSDSWPDARTNVAQDAYASEGVAVGAVNMAAVHHDFALLDELAAFYVTYEARFTTLGAMRAMTQYDSTLLSGPDSTETLIWVWNNGAITYVRECDLCNAQFYFAPARLLRILTTLNPSETTPAMQSFVQWYAPVLAHDHLLRLYYRNNAAELNRMQNTPGAFSDTDLWLAAEAAELLGAHANAPDLVTLSDADVSQLQQAVQWTVQALQSQNRTFYPNTQNFQGLVVGSVSYFNGQYVYGDQIDYNYSGYTGQTFPTPGDLAYAPTASWDLSHFHRMPLFFRALFDNKKATGIDFPTSQDIAWLTNQFVYKAFQGNFDFPLFNNFFDGSDGWYRVGYHGAFFGCPPASHCNSYALVGEYDMPCLNAGTVQGWGLLSFANPDLAKLQYSLAKLALSQDLTQSAFRTRYYYYWNQDFSVQDAQSQPQYPILLFFVLADTADRLP